VRIPRQPPHLGRLQPNSLTARQAELLDEIEALYLREGFSRHTLDALATDLRCSKMTLYTLAPSREQLAVAVIRRFLERTASEIEHSIRLVTTTEAKIEACIRSTAQRLLEMSEECFHEVVGFEPTRSAYDRFARDQTDALAALLEAEGSARSPVPAPFMASLVRVALDSVCAREFETETGIGVDDAVDHLVALALSTSRPAGRARRAQPPARGRG